MKAYTHPSLDDVSLTAVMQALSDPCRVSIVQALLAEEERELACNEISLDVAKSDPLASFRCPPGGGDNLHTLRRDQVHEFGSQEGVEQALSWPPEIDFARGLKPSRLGPASIGKGFGPRAAHQTRGGVPGKRFLAGNCEIAARRFGPGAALLACDCRLASRYSVGPRKQLYEAPAGGSEARSR